MSSILLVEDDSCIARTLARLCSASGYSAVIASNGPDALEQMQHSPPDLVILDYMLPEMDGIEVLKRLRAVNRTVPVIIYTACDDCDVREQFYLAGATDFWLKARISATEIMQSLHSHLSSSIAYAAAAEPAIAAHQNLM